MFITVLYGDSVPLLLNPESRMHNLMHYMRQNCGLDPEALIDLLPLDENESMPALYTRGPMEYLAPYVTHREKYIPVYVTLDQKDVKTIEPQLENWMEKFPEMEWRIKEMLERKREKRDATDRTRRGKSPVPEKEEQEGAKKAKKKEKKKPVGRKRE